MDKNNLNKSQNLNKESPEGDLKTKIKFFSNGFITFSSNRFGAVTSFPLMVFNGITTTVGATKILPLMLGIPSGIMLSFIYFFIVVFVKVKQEHPLRRFSLISILCVGSIYTSFFAIYDQLTGGQLKYQSATKTVNAHNTFINELRTSLSQTINNIEQEYPDVVSVNLLRQQINELTERREQSPDQDVRGNLAERTQNLDNQLQQLASVQVSYEYKIHQALNQLYQQKEDELNSHLSLEKFIVSNQSYSEIFAQDNSLFRDILIAIENVDLDSESNLLGEQFFEAPNYDDYVETPTFLVPLEILLDPQSRRQVNFIIFALTVSVFLEVIPLLLGGIQTQYKDAKKINTDKEEMKTGEKMQRRTALGQFSLLISKSLENINKTISEIWSSLSEPIGMTENLQNEFESKLTKAMTAAGLQGADKKFFLLKFYECIDSENKTISLQKNSNPEQNLDAEDMNFKVVARALIIDVMQDGKVKWISKLDNGVYKFQDPKKYQDFLSWLLDELTGNQVNYDHQDSIHSGLNVSWEYSMRKNYERDTL